MFIPLSELKANPAKYFDLAKTEAIVVTRHGRRIGRILCEEESAKLDRAAAFAELFQLSGAEPSVPDGTVYDPIKEERLREKGLLP